MVQSRKTSLNQCWNRDPAMGVEMVVGFFDMLAPTAVARLGGPVALLLDFCSFRHHRCGDAERAPWHTDARFFQPNGNGLTFWCPLDRIGPGVPGVEFRDGVVPGLGPGEALVIPPDVEHRTEVLDGERLSIEFRCAAADRLPTNLGPSPIATLRRKDGVDGVLIEAEGRPVAFLRCG
jgi:hypothetical protein